MHKLVRPTVVDRLKAHGAVLDEVEHPLLENAKQFAKDAGKVLAFDIAHDELVWPKGTEKTTPSPKAKWGTPTQMTERQLTDFTSAVEAHLGKRVLNPKALNCFMFHNRGWHAVLPSGEKVFVADNQMDKITQKPVLQTHLREYLADIAKKRAPTDSNERTHNPREAK